MGILLSTLEEGAGQPAGAPEAPMLAFLNSQDWLLLLGGLILLAGAAYAWRRRQIRPHTHQLAQVNAALRLSEEALRQSEDRFRRAFEDGPVGILLSSPNSRILRANATLCRMLDYTEPELQGLAVTDLSFPEDALRHSERTQSLLRGDAHRSDLELRLLTRTRQTLWVRITTSILYGSDRQPLYELSIIEDISERKRAEAVLRLSEERFSKAFHSGPVPIAISTLAEGRFIDANDSYLRLTGHTREELIGRTALELRLWSNESDRDSIVERLRRDGSLREVEGRLRTRRGELRECLASMETVEIEGEACLLTILHDITERKRTEEELRRSEERFQLIAKVTNDTVWDWDLTHNRIWWNEGIKTVFGYVDGKASSEASWWDQHIHPEDQHKVLTGMRDAIESGARAWSAEYRFRRSDGTYAEVYDRAHVLRDPDGRPVRMIGALMDITERKRFLRELAMARDAAVEALRLKSEFLANISHEVRTPLNGIVGMTVLLQDTPLNPEQRSFVDTIHSSTDALLTIINDLLDFSRIEAGKVHFETLDFELRATIDTTVEILAERAQSKHIELVTLVDADVPDRLCGDPGRLRQVVSNLLVNAIKFTAQGEVILQVSLDNETDEHAVLRVSVRDTGIGIPREALPYLFEAFSQVDGSTTRKHGGTGLGLAISKQLVELMGGQIGVESTLGSGSTFWFTARMAKPPAGTESGSSPGLPHAPGARVLVADDHGATRRLLVASVESLQAEAVAAETGEQAWDLLLRNAAARRPFHLAVLDSEMSDIDGLTLARRIRGEPSLAATRLILISPRAAPDDTSILRTSGVGALLAKPIRQRMLMECMARLLKTAPQHETRVWLDRRGPEPVAGLPQSGPRSQRILVAEDNPINQRVAIALLEKLGYGAQAVATGPEVLRAIESVTYDVVLMDCQLPEIDGFETTREIRRRERATPRSKRRHLHIIAMTAMAQPGARERCLAAGMDDYLSKPVRIEELNAVLEKATSQVVPPPGGREADPATDIEPRPQAPRSLQVLDPTALEALRSLANPNRPDPAGEVVALFLRHAPACIHEIELAIVRYDASTLCKAAHNLKGSAGTVGARRLAALCERIEEAAERGAVQAASGGLNELRVEYSRVRDALAGTASLS